MTPVPTYMLFSRALRCPSCGADAGEVSKFCPACGSTLVRATDADDAIGKLVIGKYRVEALIGEGGMGKVYRARQLALDKPVVLKVLRQSLLSDERTVARFQREAKAASRLNHPNSISILDFGQSEHGSTRSSARSGRSRNRASSASSARCSPRSPTRTGQG
jgi:serine/threonine-protein kinase